MLSGSENIKLNLILKSKFILQTILHMADLLHVLYYTRERMGDKIDRNRAIKGDKGSFGVEKKFIQKGNVDNRNCLDLIF